MLDLADGTLVLAHSNDLREVSHGAARGRVRSRDLEGLRRVAPDLPTLDEALAFCADRLPGIGLQLDLKRLRHRSGDCRGACAGTASSTARGSAPSTPDLSGVSRSSSRSCRARTRCRVIASGSRSAARSLRSSAAHWARSALRCPVACRPCSPAPGRSRRRSTTRSRPGRRSHAAHELDAAVYVWTVDDPRLAERLVARRRRRNHHKRSADLYDVHGVKRVSLLLSILAGLALAGVLASASAAADAARDDSAWSHDRRQCRSAG